MRTLIAFIRRASHIALKSPHLARGMALQSSRGRPNPYLSMQKSQAPGTSQQGQLPHAACGLALIGVGKLLNREKGGLKRGNEPIRDDDPIHQSRHMGGIGKTSVRKSNTRIGQGSSSLHRTDCTPDSVLLMVQPSSNSPDEQSGRRIYNWRNSRSSFPCHDVHRESTGQGSTTAKSYHLTWSSCPCAMATHAACCMPISRIDLSYRGVWCDP